VLTSWKNLDYLLHFLLKTDLQDTVRLVDDKCLEVFENKSFRVLTSAQLFTPVTPA